MATRESLLLSVRWGYRFLIDLTLYRFDAFWPRRTIVRELLANVLMKAAPDHCRDNVDEVTLTVVQHIDECSIGWSKKILKINASRILDE